MSLAHIEKRTLVVVIASTAVLLFALLASEVVEGETHAFDARILLQLRTQAGPSMPIGPSWLREGMRDVTALGSTAVLSIIVAAVIGFLIVSRRRHAALMVLASVILGTALSNSLKWSFDRPRPEFIHRDVVVYTASFPSGHTALSAVVYLTLAALLCRTQAATAVKIYLLGCAGVLTALIGVSRIYLGVHWPTDVIGGWLLGGCWALLSASVMSWLQSRGKIEGERASPK